MPALRSACGRLVLAAALAFGGLAACNDSNDDKNPVSSNDDEQQGAETGSNVEFDLAAGVYGALLQINGVIADYTTDTPAVTNAVVIPITGLGDERYLTMGGNPPGSANNIQLRMLPIGQTGSYTCGEGPSSFRLVHVYLVQEFVTYRAEGDVGDCSIEVLRADELYEGTFSGTFVNDEGQTLTAQGSFRNDGSGL